ncbi:jg2879 [Pararge aegeria aegeria]|uniref:Jg2879 protein n=1 Tax=Pararge aegeria aegeria TaxID=348720 RepID=A0A8S4SKC8_9NEOP|nr:jg2879 [Pararge aegeria aegeria]
MRYHRSQSSAVAYAKRRADRTWLGFIDCAKRACPKRDSTNLCDRQAKIERLFAKSVNDTALFEVLAQRRVKRRIGVATVSVVVSSK